VSTSFIYWNPSIYELATRVLYGRHHASRFRAIADLVPEAATVLDCCCGPALLYRRYLAPKNVSYTGLDINERFVEKLTRAGGRGEVRDLRAATPLPRAEYVVMQASLYHFLPDVEPIIERMMQAASKQVIVAEPVRNLATSDSRWLAFVGRALTDPGTGEQPHRFTEQTLDRLFSKWATRVARSYLVSGGREKIYVLTAASPQ
jgi:hypothetical protein